jgi:hypothetical protein
MDCWRDCWGAEVNFRQPRGELKAPPFRTEREKGRAQRGRGGESMGHPPP